MDQVTLNGGEIGCAELFSVMQPECYGSVVTVCIMANGGVQLRSCCRAKRYDLTYESLYDIN